MNLNRFKWNNYKNNWKRFKYLNSSEKLDAISIANLKNYDLNNCLFNVCGNFIDVKQQPKSLFEKIKEFLL